MTLILDYAWQHPDPALIKSDGYDGVMRYLSPDGSKNLSRAEAAALHAAGLSIGLVWESTAARAAEGYAAGIADAAEAEAQAIILGYPANAPIFYAVDYDAAPGAVAPYFDGVRFASHHPVGVYGSLRVVEAIHSSGVPYMWQSVAWSGGVVSGVAHLYQRLTPTRPVIPGSDENVVLHPFPMWTAGGVPPVDNHQPPTEGTIAVQTIDLRNADHVIVRAPGVVPLQRLLGVTADGLAGPHTKWALGEEQRKHGVADDFIFGPLTASALLAK